MKLYLVNHDYRYAVEQALISLFPDQTVEFTEGEPDSPGDRAVSALHRGKKYLTVTTRIHLGGKTAAASAKGAHAGLDGDELGRLGRALARRSFYKAAVGITGIRPPWGALTGVRPAKLVTNHMDSGGAAKSAKRLLTKAYYVSPEKAELCVEVSLAAQKARLRIAPGDISLYVGIPFCPTRCAYCSFVSSSVEKSLDLIEPYLQALEREIETAGRTAGDLGLNVRSVYIGGGTPTTLSDRQLARLMEALLTHFDLNGIEEYTVEAGRPDTFTEEKLQAIREMGCGRVSVNPQSMSASVLEAIGRRHSPGDTERAMELARRAGFESVNMDLIAGLPGDDPEGFGRSLERALDFRPENITVHTLAIKRGSDIRQGKYPLPGAGEVGLMTDHARRVLEAAGYRPYYLYRQKFTSGGFENTGWTLDGYECLYNIYMMEELMTIISMGCGGATKVVGENGLVRRSFNPKYPRDYISGIDGVLEKKRRPDLYVDYVSTPIL